MGPHDPLSELQQSATFSPPEWGIMPTGPDRFRPRCTLSRRHGRASTASRPQTIPVEPALAASFLGEEILVDSLQSDRFDVAYADAIIDNQLREL